LRPLGEFLDAVLVGFFSFRSFVSREERAHSAGLECENDLANLTMKVAVRPPGLVSLTIHVRQSEPLRSWEDFDIESVESGRWEIGRKKASYGHG
jgi:hypothetical protein